MKLRDNTAPIIISAKLELGEGILTVKMNETP